MVIERSITNLVVALVERGELVLVERASPQAVIAELLDALQDQAAFSQVGSFVSAVLLRSEHVDELYIDDVEIVRLVSEVG